MLSLFKSPGFRCFTGFGVVIAVLWLSIVLSLRNLESDAIDRANIAASNLAHSLAQDVASNVWAIDFTLRQFRDEWVRNRKSFVELLESERKYLLERSITQIEVTDAKGRIVFDSSRLNGPRNYLSGGRKIELNKDQMADELSIRAPALGPIWNQWTIGFSRPIHDNQRKLTGVMIVSVPSPYMQDSYDSIRLPGGGDISLIRSDGQVLASTTEHLMRMLGTPLVPAQTPGLRPNDPMSGISRRISPISNTESLFAYSKVRDYPLMLNVRQDLSAVLEPYHVLRNNHFIGGAVATGLLLAIALLLFFRQRISDTNERERTRLSAELRESEEKFRLIAANIDDVIWSSDISINTNFYISQSYERIWKRSRDSLLENPRSFIDPIHPDDRERVLAAMSVRSKKKGIPFDYEYRIILPDGSIRWIWDRGFPVRDETGHVVRYVGVAQDVTRRRQAMEELALSEKRFRTLVNASATVIYQTDAAGLPIGDCISWRQFTGQTEEDVAGMKWIKAIHPDDRATMESTLSAALIDKMPYETEVRLRRSDGEWRHMRVRGVPVFYSGNEIREWICAYEDITKGKLIEEEIHQLNRELEQRVDDRAAELTATVSALRMQVEERRLAEAKALTLAERLGGVTRRLGQAQEDERRRLAVELHDGVCSNLTAIGLNLEHLKRQLTKINLAEIENRLVNVVSMIDEAKANATDISVDLRPLLRDNRDLRSALEDYGRKFWHNTGITVEFKGQGSDTGLQGEAKIALFRIAQEALTNCAKHAKGKTIIIELSMGAAGLCLSICDDGAGFDLAKVSTGKSGMGLLSMQERAESIGGVLHVESMIGGGTRVTVTIGAAQSA